MATGEKWSAQTVATSFDSGDIMSIVQGGDNKQLDYDIPALQWAKAWVNFNGTGTVAIRDDFNVSSITDNGTGDYTVNFTSNLTDANYCIATGGGLTTNTNRVISVFDAPTVSLFKLFCVDGAGAAEDFDKVYAIVMGG